MIVASRYAKSLIDLAQETKQLEEVRKDMQLINEICANNRDFIVLLQSPVVKTDKKKAIFQQLFEGKVSKTTFAFLNLLASKRRESYIADVAATFEEQYKSLKNITTVKVESAVALDDKTKKQILELVKKTYTGDIDLVEKVNPSLIGGFVLTINDTQIDQSVKRKLNDLKKGFADNTHVPNLN
jgi:F-type H+-transporting ATPase subunit delta